MLNKIENTLVAENVFVSIGMKDILKGVTIRAEKGKVTGLLGRNGSGKSTMLKAVFGVQSFKECDVFLNGKKLKYPCAVPNALNYLPQTRFLPQAFKVEKLLKEFKVDERIIDDFPELEEDLDKSLNELSGGRERLWSTLLVIMAPTLFTMLDEPFTHIMPLHIEKLKEIIAREKTRKGFIITDHMYQSLLNVSDTIYLMKEGKTILIKNLEDIVLHGYLNSIDIE